MTATSHHQKLVKNPETGEYEWVDVYDMRQMVRPTPGVPQVSKPAYSSSSPKVSKAMGVPAHLIKKYNKRLRENGITSAHYDHRGLVIESKQARNEVLKMNRLLDLDAGYGDWAGY